MYIWYTGIKTIIQTSKSNDLATSTRPVLSNNGLFSSETKFSWNTAVLLQLHLVPEYDKQKVKRLIIS